MKDNTNNKEFWNNYVTYWENKVEQANEEKMLQIGHRMIKILKLIFENLMLQKKISFWILGVDRVDYFLFT